MDPMGEAEDAQFTFGERIAERYIVIEKLGQGGEGDVYLAQDELKQIRYAVKITRRKSKHSSSRALQTAVLRPASQHPNIVRVADAGSTCDGRAYIVSEFIDGPTLRERFK